MKAAASKNMWLGAACLCFFVSLFLVIGKREQLRAAENEKNHARAAKIRLRDEWHSLQLEHATLTGYSEISAHARRLNMQTPQPAGGTFLYMREEGK